MLWELFPAISVILNLGLRRHLVRLGFLTTIVEFFDNQAASCSARRLACYSDSLNKHMAYRRTLLAKYSHSARVFSIWAQRELGTLADMLSKYQIDQFWIALAERGFPEPERQMFPRPDWYI